MAEAWISTDEAQDVLGSIRHVLRLASMTEADPQIWKWIFLALHSALQGACVCHLVTTAAPIGAVTKQNAIEWLEYFEKSRSDSSARPPHTYLMALPDLLKAIRKAKSAGDKGEGSEVSLSDGELRYLQRFHATIRNQFQHFAPMGWSIEVSGIADLSKLTARIVRDILSYGWAFRHLGQNERRELAGNLDALERLGQSVAK